MEIDFRKLATAVRARRDGMSWRDVGQEVGGIHYSTLWRIEHGRPLRRETLERVCAWLGSSVEDFRKGSELEPPRLDTVAEIEILLFTDPLLDSETAAAIARVVRLAYTAATDDR